MTRRAGIILAGGSGSRMRPTTKKVNKHLLPIYDKPVISFPLEVMRVLDVERTVIVCNEIDKKSYADVSHWLGFSDLKVATTVQDSPDGLASAIATAIPTFGEEKFDQYIVAVGDGVYITGLDQLAKIGRLAQPETSLAWTVVQPHPHPQDFGVVTTTSEGLVTGIVEKPDIPPTSLVCTGLYAFDPSLLSRISKLTYSARGELEISDLLQTYCSQEQLRALSLDEEVLWFDVGTPDRLLEASMARRKSIIQNSLSSQATGKDSSNI